MTLPVQYTLFNQGVDGTTAVNGATQETDADDVTLIVAVEVDVLKGTSPTCDVKIQHSPDGTTWIDHGTTIAQFTADGTKTVAFKDLDIKVRAVTTLGGTTPSAYVKVSASVRKA